MHLPTSTAGEIRGEMATSFEEFVLGGSIRKENLIRMLDCACLTCESMDWLVKILVQNLIPLGILTIFTIYLTICCHLFPHVLSFSHSLPHNSPGESSWRIPHLAALVARSLARNRGGDLDGAGHEMMESWWNHDGITIIVDVCCCSKLMFAAWCPLAPCQIQVEYPSIVEPLKHKTSRFRPLPLLFGASVWWFQQ